jgi:hypothetical protein
LIYSGLTSVIPKGYVDNKNINNQQNKNPRQKRSSAPHGELCSFKGLFTFKQKKGKKDKKQKQPAPHADKIPVGCQIFHHIRRIEKHIPIGVVERMSQQKTNRL